MAAKPTVTRLSTILIGPCIHVVILCISHDRTCKLSTSIQ